MERVTKLLFSAALLATSMVATLPATAQAGHGHDYRGHQPCGPCYGPRYPAPCDTFGHCPPAGHCGPYRPFGNPSGPCYNPYR